MWGEEAYNLFFPLPPPHPPTRVQTPLTTLASHHITFQTLGRPVRTEHPLCIKSCSVPTNVWYFSVANPLKKYAVCKNKIYTNWKKRIGTRMFEEISERDRLLITSPSSQIFSLSQPAPNYLLRAAVTVNPLLYSSRTAEGPPPPPPTPRKKGKFSAYVADLPEPQICHPCVPATKVLGPKVSVPEPDPQPVALPSFKWVP